MNRIKLHDYRIIKTIFEPSEELIKKLELISDSFDYSNEFKDNLSFSPVYTDNDKKTFHLD